MGVYRLHYMAESMAQKTHRLLSHADLNQLGKATDSVCGCRYTATDQVRSLKQAQSISKNCFPLSEV